MLSKLKTPNHLGIFFIVLQLQLFPFLPITLLSSTMPHSHSQPPPHCLCPWVLYLCSFACPFSSFPHYSPSPFPLATVSFFFISKSLVLFCSFVCFVQYVTLIGEIIWYLSFTAWLISLSLFHSMDGTGISIHGIWMESGWNLQFHPCFLKR